MIGSFVHVYNLWLNKDGVLLEEGAEEEGQILDKVLLVVLSVLEGLSDVCGQWQHLKVTQQEEGVRWGERYPTDKLNWRGDVQRGKYYFTCLSCVMTRVNMMTNCSEY